MQYLKPYTYFYKKPNKGWTNVLMIVVCGFIPIVGQMVIFGYRKKVADELERDPNSESYPDFDFNNFMDYLKLGIWPFITQFIGMMLIIIPFIVLYVFMLIGLATQSIHPIIFVVFLAFWSFMSYLINVIVWPMEMHAMKTQKFAPMAQFKFAFQFIKTVGFASVVSVIISNILMTMFVMLGMLLCFVGVYPTAAIANMAIQHIQTQLYLHYLEEGGEPIAEALSYSETNDDRPPPRTARAEIE